MRKTERKPMKKGKNDKIRGRKKRKEWKNKKGGEKNKL